MNGEAGRSLYWCLNGVNTVYFAYLKNSSVIKVNKKIKNVFWQ